MLRTWRATGLPNYYRACFKAKSVQGIRRAGTRHAERPELHRRLRSRGLLSGQEVRAADRSASRHCEITTRDHSLSSLNASRCVHRMCLVLLDRAHRFIVPGLHCRFRSRGLLSGKAVRGLARCAEKHCQHTTRTVLEMTTVFRKIHSRPKRGCRRPKLLSKAPGLT